MKSTEQGADVVVSVRSFVAGMLLCMHSCCRLDSSSPAHPWPPCMPARPTWLARRDEPHGIAPLYKLAHKICSVIQEGHRVAAAQHLRGWRLGCGGHSWWGAMTQAAAGGQVTRAGVACRAGLSSLHG